MWREQEQVYMQPQHLQQQTLHPGMIATVERAHHHHHHHRSTSMDLPIPSNPRASRNMAEKQRRDNLNTNISAMAALVPIIAESPRKMDKISILRLAAAFLRAHYTLGHGTADFLPRELADLDLEQYIVDNLIDSGGFFIVVTTAGKIVYVSRQVQEHLGHTQADLLGHALEAFVHPEDIDELTKNLTPDEMQMQGMVSSSLPQITDGTHDNSNSSEESSASPSNERRPFREQRRNFELRLLHRTASRREHTQYEWFEISGMLRLADACRNSELNANRANRRDVATITGNDIVFVGVARLLMRRPITKISIIDANKDEYITRHLVDGRIIYCDHRISVVAGYLSEEVSGISAFHFMHKKDRIWAMAALRQMYDNAETCASSCYRLTSKTGESIYLRTHGYLEIDKDSQIAVSLVCINTLVSEEEGIKLMKQMKKRYSATVSETLKVMIQNEDVTSLDLNADSPQSSTQSSAEDTSELEDAITYLVSDLSSPLPEDCMKASPVLNEQYMKAAMISQHLPPAAAQARKLGIQDINRYLTAQGKGGRNQKQLTDADDSTSTERQESSKTSGKIKLHEISKKTQNVLEQHNVQCEQQASPQPNCVISAHEVIGESGKNNPRNPGTSRYDASQSNLAMLSPTAKKPVVNDVNSPALCEKSPYDVKVERNNVDVYKQQQEPVIEYLEKNITSETEGQQYALKRIYSDEDIRTSCNKKRHRNVVYTSDSSEEQQNALYVECKPFVGENLSELSADFNQYNANSRSLKIESPSSTLNEIIDDYQQIDSSIPLIPSNSEDDEFIDLHDLKEDTLLSPCLDTNPDTFHETKVQLADSNAIDNEIRRKHLQLMNSMALQESQLNILARDLKNPALQSRRGSLTPLQVEHNMQKQILETLQQDHVNIQRNIKYNIGV
ncbi:circadian locomoter output cycles protein kaput-like isoform X2 [Ceratina calcarata]|uniref:Circadian locomoter output cycles protein kaput-like isoform X2 n=1 Tax=Ceratina calcarata TaxID=156304 RepID=A0AAJ7IXE0_9HYME|nr:circadian locomoter output cycles protein kaput-like isoform X2 [Ceratina calcarata]